MSTKPRAALMAAVAAGLLAAACNKKTEGPVAETAAKDAAVAATTAGTIFCGGVNACSGKSACKTKKNECAGKNACKGQGVVELSAADCKAKGGSIEPTMM